MSGIVLRTTVQPTKTLLGVPSFSLLRQIKFSEKKIEESGMCDIPCFRGGFRRGRYTKFEVNQTNLK